MTQTGCSDKVARSQAQPATMHAAAETPMTLARPGPYTPIMQTSPSGLTATWLPYGAHLQSVTLPDGTNILAQHSDAKDYSGGAPYLGSLIGRVANRVGGASFTIDGETYTVAENENGHTLHGGPAGFDTRIWDAAQEGEELVFRHTSPAGHQGYPGNLDVTVRATINDRELQVKFIAVTDAPTPVNLSQHGYWNPTGLFNGKVDTLTLTSPADRYTEVGDDLIPTGSSPLVNGTAYDFRKARRIGPTLIDVNLLVPGTGMREMARLTDGVRTVTLLSDYPGLQIYSGDALDSIGPRAALAMEPQYPPNAVNQPVDGQDTILRPGEVYRHTITYRFGGPGFEGPTLQDTTP